MNLWKRCEWSVQTPLSGSMESQIPNPGATQPHAVDFTVFPQKEHPAERAEKGVLIGGA